MFFVFVCLFSYKIKTKNHPLLASPMKERSGLVLQYNWGSLCLHSLASSV